MTHHRASLFLSVICLTGCVAFERDITEPLSASFDAPQACNWQPLFNGANLDGWQGYQQEAPGPQWVVSDSVLILTGRGGGTIITDQVFEDFELSLDWKISAGGNSGIFFHVGDSPDPAEKVWWTGLEYQILDNRLDVPEEEKAGSLFGLIPAKGDATHTVGSFNRSLIRVEKGHVEFMLNDKPVLHFDTNSDAFAQRVSGTKFADKARFARTGRGHIALQDHGDQVAFRNIKIRVLSEGCSD